MNDIKYINRFYNPNNFSICLELPISNGKSIYPGDVLIHKSGRKAILTWHKPTQQWDLEAINDKGNVSGPIVLDDWEVE